MCLINTVYKQSLYQSAEVIFFFVSLQTLKRKNKIERDVKNSIFFGRNFHNYVKTIFKF